MWLLAGSPKFSKIDKNTKMFTKWVAVARKSLLTAAFCIIFRDTADGDIFGQKSNFWRIMFFFFDFTQTCS